MFQERVVWLIRSGILKDEEISVFWLNGFDQSRVSWCEEQEEIQIKHYKWSFKEYNWIESNFL